MTTRPSLLPPSSTRLERALEQATARVGDVPTANELWDPAACPLELLPWLAWALSVDRWQSDWREAEKREAVATAIELQRKKGTPAALDQVLASFDALLKLTEWHEMRPVGEPHTFTVELPLVLPDGATGGTRASREFAEAIVRDVVRSKPLRSHWRLIQSLASYASLRVIAAGRTASLARVDCQADTTVETYWATYLQDENGEPIQDENGDFIQGDELSDPLVELVADSAGVTIAGAAFATGGGFPAGWHNAVHSAADFSASEDFFAEATYQGGRDFAFGLSPYPLSDGSFASIPVSILADNGTSWLVCLAGSVGAGGPIAVGDVLRIEKIGGDVVWKINGATKLTQPAPFAPGDVIYLDVDNYGSATPLALENLKFEALA